ncbi:toprim domain-containing protein [Chitinophaga sp. 30R24]|uniref:toprim domain-containing protein n=1 Tax=Chitinophaga sp. 30R24 TaxID=3248838 RepID=UPI003B8F6A33
MTIAEAKEIDMVDYLARLGFQPVKVSEPHYWYNSPLRSEKTPSFKINRILNKWKDWGSGEGGNIIDFGILYHKCNVADFLKRLQGNVPLIVNNRPRHEQNPKDIQPEIKVLKVKPITSLPLLKYLEQRSIPVMIADKYLKEVSYELRDKIYYALGFKNDQGGYELRNQYIKAASSPKTSTYFDNGEKEMAVFEGFFNFLSFQALYQGQEQTKRNFLVLNSLSFFNKNLSIMQAHERVKLYLDNDNEGHKFTSKALKIDCHKFSDERQLYQNYEDLNDWIVNIGSPRHQQRPKP